MRRRKDGPGSGGGAGDDGSLANSSRRLRFGKVHSTGASARYYTKNRVDNPAEKSRKQEPAEPGASLSCAQHTRGFGSPSLHLSIPRPGEERERSNIDIPAGLEEPLLQACRKANFCPREVSNPPRCSQGDTELEGHQDSLTARFETQTGLVLALGSPDQNVCLCQFCANIMCSQKTKVDR